ncbi:DUF1638 domain-containing protein [bacterium]|nr:DUF1638 domain-containing protein [bacterium]
MVFGKIPFSFKSAKRKIKIIACEALSYEIKQAAAKSRHETDIELLAFGLHNTPDELRDTIQSQIDECEDQDYELIALGYGLCSRGTADIVARSIPIIIPRAHDCITLFLGSRERYNKEFAAHPGTYYYSPGWIDFKEGDVQQGFIDDVHERNYQEKYRQYLEKYGEENAKYLIEQEQQWYQHYTRATFINMGLGDIEAYRKFTHEIADSHNWEYAEIEGSMSLIERLVNLQWDEDDFLYVEPGHKIAESFDEDIIRED